MKKKFIITFIFFSFFFLSPKPIYAEDKQNGFSIIWTWITNNLSWLLPVDTQRYTSNEPLLTIDNSKNFTKFTDINNSQSDRSTSESVRAYRRGLLFYEILNQVQGPDGVKYEDKIIKVNNNSECHQDFPTTDIICFYYQKFINNQSTEKILYTRDDPNNPIDYPQNLSTKCNKTLPNPDICYINAYINYRDIPNGYFSGKKDAAVISSNQFNDSISTPLPDIDQGEDAPFDNNTSENVEIIAKNSDEKEQAAHLNFITKENRKNIPCTSKNEKENRQHLRDFRDQGLLPAKWQKSSVTSGITITKKDSDDKASCEQNGHGRGMSQFGALGMAMSGYDYRQILSSYYGTNNPSDPHYTGITIETKNEFDKTMVTVELTDNCDDNIDCDSEKYSSCVNIANSNSDRFTLTKIKHPKEYQEHKTYDFDCTDSRTDYEKEKEEFTDWWNKNCTYQITLSLDDYLLGLAEIFPGWHIETHKALTVAARNIAYIKSHGFNSSLNNGSGHQVFRCKTLSGNMGQPNNQNTAVAMTKNEFMTINGEIATTEYASIHCAPSTNFTHFDGTAFELVGLEVFNQGVGNVFDGVCYINNDYSITTTSTVSNSVKVLGVNTDSIYDSVQMSNEDINISGSEINGIFHFNDPQTKPNHRIVVNYDIASIDNNPWLKPYQDDCYLDGRVFPALNQLLDTLKTELPQNDIKFYSCYRSISQQNKLWSDALQKYGNADDASKYVARPGQTPHHTGRAIDIGDQNGKFDTNSLVYQWLLQNGNRFGFYNYKPEPWHWEYNP